MAHKTKAFAWHFDVFDNQGGDVLRDLLTRTDKPLGTVFERDLDLEGLIGAERNIDVLVGALARARDTHDTCWQLKIGEVLLHRGLQKGVLAPHIDRLLEAEHFDLAARHFSRVRQKNVGEHKYRLWRVLLADGQGDLDQLNQDTTWFLSGRTQASEHHLAHCASVHARRGDYDQALELLSVAMDRTDKKSAAAIAAQYLETLTLSLGPEEATQTLADMGDVFPVGSVGYLRQRANIMMALGRNDDALADLARAVEREPLNAALYPLIQRAAFASDKREAFDQAVDRLATLKPGHLVVLMHRLEKLPHETPQSNDVSRVLLQIRAQSEWQYQTSKLLKAFEGQDTDAQNAADAAAGHALVQERTRTMSVANFAYFMGNEDWDIKAICDRMRPLRERSFHNASDIASLLRVMIAAGEVDAAKSMYDRCAPGLRSSAVVAPFGMYFDAQAGLHSNARSQWNAHLQRTGNHPISAPTAPPEPVTQRYAAHPDAILLFCVVFNGVEFVSWFLDHYRKLGVDHFFIVDNGSTDGTFEVLRDQPDVSLYHQPESFSESRCGIVWINHLMRRFGCGHWCLHVDIDEALVFDGSDDGRTIRDLAASMELEGAESLAAFMLDIYPERTDAPSEGDPFERSCYIDDDYIFLPYEHPPYFFAKGGIRGRISGQNLLMTKAPFVKMSPSFCYTLNNHHHTHVPLSKEQGAVLHYKFVGDIAGRVREAIQRAEHFLGARFYQLLEKPLKSGALADERSIKYGGVEHLKNLGYVIGQHADD